MGTGQRTPAAGNPNPQNHERRLWFRSDPRVRNSAGRIAPGVDVRGQGGYAIVPPSPGYTVIADVPVADWTPWLMQPGMVLPPPAQERPISSGGADARASNARFEGYRNSVLDTVRQSPDGQKHLRLCNAALALGGVAAEAGFSDKQCVAWLLAHLIHRTEAQAVF